MFNESWEMTAWCKNLLDFFIQIFSLGWIVKSKRVHDFDWTIFFIPSDVCTTLGSDNQLLNYQYKFPGTWYEGEEQDTHENVSVNLTS